MKSQLLILQIRLPFLLAAFLFAASEKAGAQCSADIPSVTQTVCVGKDVNIPVSLSGVAPFVINYQINGIPQPAVVAPGTSFYLLVSNVQQPLVVVLSNVVDDTGCQATLSGITTVAVSPPVLLSVLTTPASCTGGGFDGSIWAGANGGLQPYQYVWSPALSGEAFIGNVAPGAYSVTVVDANGCSATSQATVGMSIPVITNATVIDAACNGAINASIDLSVQTEGNLTYLWSNGATTQDLSHIPAGTYTITVTHNMSGCTDGRTVNVTQPTAIEVSAITTPVLCNGGENGSIETTVTGGTPPYTYSWSNGAITPQINNLTAGTYTVVVTDANGCTETLAATVTQTQAITLAPVVQPPTCGNSDGTIDLQIVGGTPPYQQIWSTGAVQEDISGLSTGTYSVTVTDASGCTAATTQSIGPYTATITVNDAQCLHNLNLNVFGGTGPYVFAWSDNSASEDLNGVSEGTYSVTVTDMLGCSTVQSVSVTALTPVEVSISLDNSVCTGGLTAHLSGGNLFGVSYLWSTGSNYTFITNIPAGTYTVTVTSTNSCTATATQTTTEVLSSAQWSVSSTPTTALCFGSPSGGINLTVSGSAPPFSFLWSNGAVTEDLVNVVANTYMVTVTNANGCTKVYSRVVSQPAVINMSWVVTNSNCSQNGSINLTVSGGVPPYTYSWQMSDGTVVSTVQDPVNLSPSSFRVLVTDANGCFKYSPYIQVQSPVLSVIVEQLSAQCSSAVLTANVSGGTAPYHYEWSGPNITSVNSQNITVSSSGNYGVFVTDVNGCLGNSTYHVSLTQGGACGYVAGKVVLDSTLNCLTDAGEPGLGGWLVRAEGATGTFYGVSDVQGNYWVGVSEGTYTMAVIPPNALWEVCPPGPDVTVSMSGDTVSGGDLLVKPVYACPLLSVSIGTGLLRRCFSSNYYYVSYCNLGTLPAVDPYVVLTLDPFLTPVASSLPYTTLANGELRFEVGDLGIGACGTFLLQVQVSCDATIGQTHCTEAHIYPDGSCVPPDLNWSGASLRLSSQCSADSLRFTIRNAGTGDMQNASEFIVLENAVTVLQAPVQLAAGDIAVVAVPANGSTWRMEVEQVPFHPDASSPSLSVEGCTNNASFSTGYVAQFPNDDTNPWIDIDCTPNRGSYDPNDKQGFPLGYGSEHYIRPGTELEYMIRFQNTGTDTAFTVRVVDTLSSWLDPATIRPGVSSHDYQFNLTGPGIAEFLFENILLPDSNVNQAGSNGFLKFSILPKADAPLETLIENTAEIYFDFNEPIVTNTTRHRLGENFLSVGLWQPQRPEYEVSVSPNPFAETARLEIKGLKSSQPVHLQIVDLQGRIVTDETFSGSVFTLRKTGLPSGMYLFKLDQKGVLIGSGKLVVKE